MKISFNISAILADSLLQVFLSFITGKSIIIFSWKDDILPDYKIVFEIEKMTSISLGE